MPTRLLLASALMLACASAQAAISCEQLALVAQETIRLRDQGSGLNRLLAEAERSGAKENAAPDDVALIKSVIRNIYDSTITPAELMEACKKGNPAPR